MLLHMPDHLVDRIQHADVTPLRSNPLHQPLRKHRSDNPIRLCRCSRKLLHQLSATQTLRRTKLRIPNPNILGPTHPMHNPLPHIPTKMKHKIAHSVLMDPMPLPYLHIRQFIQTNPQVFRHRIQLLTRIIQKQNSNRVVHVQHSIRTTRTLRQFDLSAHTPYTLKRQSASTTAAAPSICCPLVQW
jgi:hypothetical protein